MKNLQIATLKDLTHLDALSVHILPPLSTSLIHLSCRDCSDLTALTNLKCFKTNEYAHHKFYQLCFLFIRRTAEGMNLDDLTKNLEYLKWKIYKAEDELSKLSKFDNLTRLTLELPTWDGSFPFQQLSQLKRLDLSYECLVCPFLLLHFIPFKDQNSTL